MTGISSRTESFGSSGNINLEYKKSLSEGEKEEWEFTDEMKNNQDTTLPAGTERMVSIQIQFRQHCSLQGFLICGKQKAGFRSALEMLYLLEDCLQEQDN